MSTEGQINKISKSKEDSHKDEELKELLEENIKISKKVLKLVEKNHNILFMARVWGFVKLLIILIPLILGIIYLPPMLEKVFEYYQELLGIGENLSNLNPMNKFNK